jgi:CO/xanthine dehydrogenase Mo-binding subunit
VLGLPPSRVRIIATPNGGGFGGKSDPFNHEIVVAKLSLMTNRPVKISLTREEVFQCHRGRHSVLMRSKLGMSRDGKIKGLHFESLLDGGAYGSYGVATTYYTGALQTVTYEVPAYRFDGVRAFTNKAPGGPKRGHGTPQPRFLLEVQLGKAAARLGLDPAELRLNMLQPPQSVTANWLYVNSTGLGECIEKVVEGSGWKERRGRLPRGHGLGLACSSYISGAGLPIYWNAMPHSGVQLKVDRGGGVAVFCGETEIGQGSDTVLATCAGDTDLTPVDLGSYSSRVTLMMGNAAIQAAERAREIIAKHAAKRMDIPGNRVVFAGNRVFDAEDPERGLSFAEAVQIAEAEHGTIGTVGSYRPPPNPGRYRGSGVGPTATYSYTAAVVEILADEETGMIEVKKVWIAHDIGRALNRNLVIGQVEGGVYMGLGEVLMEDMAYREKRFCVLKHPSVLEYKTITTHEMPEVVTYLVEHPDPRGPFGAKEVGQGPLLPMMPAVANALHDALGIRVDQVPIHPDLVLKALKAKDRRAGPAEFPDLKMTDTQRVRTQAEGGDGTAPRTPREQAVRP